MIYKKFARIGNLFSPQREFGRMSSCTTPDSMSFYGDSLSALQARQVKGERPDKFLVQKPNSDGPAAGGYWQWEQWQLFDNWQPHSSSTTRDLRITRF